MRNVLIALDGSEVDTRIVDLAGTLLAGKELEIILLHVMPIPFGEDPGWGNTVVLEGFLAAEECGSEMAPLVEQLHARLGTVDQEHREKPRLAPRHLIHGDNQSSVIERCGIAQGRQASIALLATAAQSLRQHGLDAVRVTRDSAIGNPAEIIRETARHFGVDLVIVGSRDSSQAWQVAEDPGRMAHAPCPVLVVPAPDNDLQGAGSRSAGRVLVAHE